MPSFISPAEAIDIRAEFRNLEDTVKAVFWDVSWAAWTIDRPNGWDAGTDPEAWEMVATGTGRLRENGAGGPVIDENVIYTQAPYVLRTDVDAFDAFRTADSGESEHDVSTAWLVIESRLFRVNAFSPRGGQRQHANAYLTEVFDRTLPAVTP